METDENKKFYELCEKYETDNIEDELEKFLKPYKNGSMALAQINTISGDIKYNAEKIVKYIQKAQNVGLDLVIFPEFALTGYALEDATEKFPIIAKENIKWLNEIAKITTKTTALVGCISPENNESSIAVLSQGEIQNIIKKSDLSKNIIDINGIKYGIFVGDINEQIKEKPDIIIYCCANPVIIQNEKIKNDRISSIAKNNSIPVVYVNQVGATDSYSFAGAGMVFDKNGKLFAGAKSFEEQFLIFNLFKNLGKIYPVAHGLDNSGIKDEFSLDYDYDLERTYKTVIQGVKDYFGKTGFKRAVLGLSGGLDSTVCAVILADAIGSENVVGISMPSKITSQESKSDAQILAQNLGINFITAPIKEMVETTNNCLQNIFDEAEKNWEGRYQKSFTMDNIQARSRAMFLWGVSNEFESCLPIATSDKSEAYMGYATINGDMSGGFAPIADITKTKLFALARWLNKNRPVKNAIPQSVIDKKPGAELAIDPNTGKALCAEDALMPYEFLDEIIWRIENKKESYQQMLNSIFLYEKQHNISKEQKIQWLDKFFRRMSTALYKKSILPPYVIVDSPTYDYKQPITSSRINYKGTSQDIIAETIKNIKENSWQL